MKDVDIFWGARKGLTCTMLYRWSEDSASFCSITILTSSSVLTTVYEPTILQYGSHPVFSTYEDCISRLLSIVHFGWCITLKSTFDLRLREKFRNVSVWLLCRFRSFGQRRTRYYRSRERDRESEYLGTPRILEQKVLYLPVREYRSWPSSQGRVSIAAACKDSLFSIGGRCREEVCSIFLVIYHSFQLWGRAILELGKFIVELGAFIDHHEVR